MNNKNQETNIWVQPEDQKRKAAKPLESAYLCEIFRLEESEFLFHPTLYSSLVLGLKACTMQGNGSSRL